MREDKFMEMSPATIDRKMVAAAYLVERADERMKLIAQHTEENGWDDRQRENYQAAAEMKAQAIEQIELLEIVRMKRGGWTRFYVTAAGSKIHSRHNCAALVRAHNPELIPELSGLPSFVFTWTGGSHLCHYCRHADKRERA